MIVKYWWRCRTCGVATEAEAKAPSAERTAQVNAMRASRETHQIENPSHDVTHVFAEGL